MPAPAPSNNMPDWTAPVRSSYRQFAGITGNMDNGTAQGSSANNLTNGNANNNIGGNVYRATGQSSNQFPVSPADVEYVGGGGSAPAPSQSSNNPPTVQAQTADRVNYEKPVEFTSDNVSEAAAGYYTQFPKSTENISLGQSSSTVGQTWFPGNTNAIVPSPLGAGVNTDATPMVAQSPQIVNEQNANAYVGISKSVDAYNSNDPNALTDEARVVKDTLPEIGGHIDGKAAYTQAYPFGSPDALYTTTQREALPGGVPVTPQIGQTNNPNIPNVISSSNITASGVVTVGNEPYL